MFWMNYLVISSQKIAGFASMFGLHKLYSKQSLLHFLWKKVHRLEKSTPTPLVALQTNISYEYHQSQTGYYCL